MVETMKAVFVRIFGSDTPQERERLICELEGEERNPFITVRLSRVQLRALAYYIVMLPHREFYAMVLYHCMGYSAKRIGELMGIDRAKGVIMYCEDRLAQCMGMPRPIGRRYWHQACGRALDIYQFRSTAIHRKHLGASASR